ncbi:MAG: DUF3365 domain-containing protein [Helicobacteraceae bacterium]|nr:DUF3365 domain-containing protein [Helicobacteraceae bacterium]
MKKSLVIFLSYFLISIISIAIILQFITSANSAKELSLQQVVQEAKAHFQGMLDTRIWNAKYGGVYVKAVDGLKPNPYLKNNTLQTDKNETLIKINPAWMTRQISQITNKEGLYHYKITSLIPLNPSNIADEFETKALKYFEKNLEKKYFYSFNKENQSFDFMGALVTKQSCLQCHEHQGYKIGDIRGGIRVSLPLTLYNEQIHIIDKKTKFDIIIISTLAMVLMLILSWLIKIVYKRKYEIENYNEILEKRVIKRTEDLEAVVSHEQYLKDIFKIATEVNEMLITSYSTKTILVNATEKLSQNSFYSLVLSGLISDDIFEVVSKSSECKSLIPKKLISFKSSVDKNFLIEAIEKARKLKHPIIEKISDEIVNKNSRRGTDIEFEWMIVLPLLHGFENDIYGAITLFCSREEGFEVEEMKILENIAHDISIALYSHKQRDSMLEMEKEKIANYEETILAFVNIIEQRDTYTAGHTIRVAKYCTLIAKGMGINEKEIHRLEKAAILHDIGKVATPDTILLKPGKLSHLEYELIKQHSKVGADMLERISIYKDLATIIRYHHSRFDGKGYPKTTSADEIPLLSHIMIVADAFDAMTTNRIYRPRKTVSEALEEIEHESGRQFHPDVVKVTLNVLKDVDLSSSTQLPTSELEHRRMSYFFKDSLTSLYNEDYLATLLNTTNYEYQSLDILELKNFTQYNKTNSWESGDKFLKDFAKLLKESFLDSIIIRYHGDDFIVLSKNISKENIEKIINSKLVSEEAININVLHYNIDKNFTYEKFKNIVN